jgi:hypothetical protein
MLNIKGTGRYGMAALRKSNLLSLGMSRYQLYLALGDGERFNTWALSLITRYDPAQSCCRATPSGSSAHAPVLSHRSPSALQTMKRRFARQSSNGQTEGQITRLKLVRRQMYGRGKLDLLQARMIGAQ